MPLIVPECWSAVASWFLNGKFIAQTTYGYHLRSPRALTQAEVNNLFGVFKDAFEFSGSLQSQLSNQIAIESLTVTDIRTATGPQFIAGGSDNGAVSGDVLPPQNCMVTTLKTALRGRRFRGRNYFTGIPESKQDAGQLSVAAAAGATLFWTKLVDLTQAYNGDTVPGVISRLEHVCTEITGVSTNTRVYTQRRRSYR